MTRAEQLEQMEHEANSSGLDRAVPVFADLMRSIDTLYSRWSASDYDELVEVLEGALVDAAERIREGVGLNTAPSATWLLQYRKNVQAARGRREAEEESRWAEDEEA